MTRRNHPSLFKGLLSGLCCVVSLNAGATADEAQPLLPADTSRVYDIEEVVVVASPKGDVQLRKQPSSVSLFSRQLMQAADVTRLKGLSVMAPNFFMPDYGSRYTSAVYIRGIGSRMNAPAVGLYVDNIPYIDKTAYDFDFADVERVDVLRGPQGTLYGRNSMGGLIRVFTADPFRSTGTRVHLGASTGNTGGRASVTTYLHPSSRLALSLSGFYSGEKGFRRNATTGQKADGSSDGGGKLRLAWRPADDWKLDWNTLYEASHEDACPYYYKGTVGLGEGEAEPYPDEVGSITQNRPSTYRRNLLTSGLSVVHEAPRYTFSSVTAYQHFTDRLFMDQDFVKADIFSLAQRQRAHNISEEIVFKNRPAGRWEWTSGAYFSYQGMHTSCPVTFYSDGIDFLNSQLAPAFSNMPMPGMSVTFTDPSLRFFSRMETPSLNGALYHRSVVRDLLTDGLSLTLGLRLDYSHERLDLKTPGSQEAAYRFRLPAFGVDLPLTSPTTFAGTHSETDWQLLPQAALQYSFSSGIGNVYASVAKGYRAGGYNIQSYSDLSQSLLRRNMMLNVQDNCAAIISHIPGMPDAQKDKIIAAMEQAMAPYVPEAPQVQTLYYRPEQTWDYEVGTHLTLLDGALQLDAAGFLMNTTDQQLARFAESGMGRSTVNAGKSRSYGAEVSARTAFLDNRLNLSGMYGYTHATFTSYDAGEGLDYAGNRVPFAPEHTFSAMASYRQPFEQSRLFRALTATAQVDGAGRIYWDEANTFSQPFYATLSLRLSLEMAAGVTLDVWGKNLTGTSYDTFSFDTLTRRFAQRGAPAHMGVDLRLSF